MRGTDGLIDLTGSPDATHLQLLPRRRRACSAIVDVTGGAQSDVDTVDLSWPAQQDEAGPSHYMQQPATLREAEATGASVAAFQQADAPQSGKGAGKRKRSAPAEGARQAETKQQEAEARRAAAKKRKAEARATKKAAEQKEKQMQQKRVDQCGRTVRYSSNAPQQTKERMARAMPNSGHRLFLLDRTLVSSMTSENGPAEEFTVLGATANVYSVSVGKHPSCSCPDFQKGNLCKHYLFIMLRVLRLDRSDPLVWQKALLKSEAEQVLGGTRSTRADTEVLADQSVISHYRRLTGKDAASSSAGAAGPHDPASKQRPIEGECAICYDSLKAGGKAPEDKVTFCQECGNNVHVECFKRWTASKKGSGDPVTCVYCRCPWVVEAGGGGASLNKDYVNLRDVSHEHQSADTSLHSLYGDTAVWIQAHNGRMGRRQAANLWRLSQAM
ncbi:TPA: hypothetical protein ACH3X1_012076 [Trebouxia sp. C0004]